MALKMKTLGTWIEYSTNFKIKRAEYYGMASTKKTQTKVQGAL